MAENEVFDAVEKGVVGHEGGSEGVRERDRELGE